MVGDDGSMMEQLFDESEEKKCKGLYPSTVNFSTDLQSNGQYIQVGKQILFETLLQFHEIEGNYRCRSMCEMRTG